MVLFFDSSEFFQSSGNASALFQENLRDAIATHACNIWANYPRFITNGRNPASSFARGYMNQVCSPINPTPPPLTSNFTGGQCEVQYNVNLTVDIFPSTVNCNRSPTSQSSFSVTVWGPIGGARLINPAGVCGGFRTLVLDCHGTASQTRQSEQFPFVISSFGYGRFLRVASLTVSRVDGQPDDCGNPPPEYAPEPPPGPGDLNTTINIINIDGIDNTFELLWNNTNNNYNFPMTFKLQGTNVTFSTGGITIYGDPEATSLNDEKDTAPPGSDGGRDSDGNDYTIIYPDSDFPELPQFVQPNLAEAVLDYVVCEQGVIDALTKSVKLIPGTDILLQLILDTLSNLVEEVCVEQASDVGIPEIYPVLPGVERPVVVLYYKEVVEGKKGASTYTATVVHPSSSTVASLENLTPRDRILGQYICSILLADGSRVVASGGDEGEANLQFNFMLSLIDPAFVPQNPQNTKVLTFNPRLQIKSVKCTQVEYYPNGKQPGVNPSDKYFLPV